ncbi:MAG: hypothetical protein M3032_01135, partial [Verrucomicrobiota bacterium]|nr:hypothetical protein [Verrucomicrobiota bacterium]
MDTEPESNLQPEIAHVLLMDVVGYSKLLVDEQIALLARLNTVVRNSPRFRAAEADAKLVRLPTGDGMALLFFDNPEAPLQCALEIAHAGTTDQRLQLRMGAHSGPIRMVPDVNDRANVAGAGIDIAQRVLDCGDAGHILLSKRMADDLRSYRHWHDYLHDLGECEVKHGLRLHLFNLCRDGVGNPVLPQKIQQQRLGIGRWRKRQNLQPAASPRRKRAIVAAVAAALLIASAGATLMFRSRESFGAGDLKPADRSIAVLPFGNLSVEKENAYFADGVQDEILRNLSRVSGIKVISRTSVMQYQVNSARNVGEIARALGVTFVLEGSVQ